MAPVGIPRLGLGFTYVGVGFYFWIFRVNTHHGLGIFVRHGTEIRSAMVRILRGVCKYFPTTGREIPYRGYVGLKYLRTRCRYFRTNLYVIPVQS